MSALAATPRSGYFWAGLISVIVAPLAYYRSMVLGRVTNDGSVVGAYGVVLILIELVTTFVLLGGGTVVINYVAKLRAPAQISGFLTRYAALNLGVLLLAAVVMVSMSSMQQLIEHHLGIHLHLWLLLLAPFVMLGTIALCALSALQQFALASFLTNMQMLLVCVSSTALLWWARDYFAQHAIPLLLATVLAAYVVVLVSAAGYFRRAGIGMNWHTQFPAGFWRFTLTIHVNSICNFVYRSGDQLFVLGALGVRELGSYFVAVQLADLIGFLPLRTAQVMLARFSGQIRERDYTSVAASYALLVRVITCIAGVVALSLIFFAQPVAALFGEWASEKALYLQLLAVVAVVGCLNSVNSMLIMAFEATSHYLYANLAQMLLQLVLTLALIDPYGVRGVIIAKFAGAAILQAGLFYIVRNKLSSLRACVSWHYFFTVAMTIAGLVLSQLLVTNSWPIRMLVFGSLSAAFLLVLRVGADDFRALLARG